MWESVTWPEFHQAIAAYRDDYYVRRSEERYYCEIYRAFSPMPIHQYPEHAETIVKFLNQWHCRFPRNSAPGLLARWIRREAKPLCRITSLSLKMPEITEHLNEFSRLHDSLIDLRKAGFHDGIHNMGDACASKILHLTIPPLFVMWDARIKPAGSDYGAFMASMHQFAFRLTNELAPADVRDDIEGYLQHQLGYPIRKPLSKYIDEFNWYRAWR